MITTDHSTSSNDATRRGSVLFTGGIPAGSPEAVFDLIAETVGGRALYWPDGETSVERSGWIAAVNALVFTETPCFEPVQSPLDLPPDHVLHKFKAFKVRPGAQIDLRGRLPYARDAIASYERLKQVRADGRAPEKTRLQCSIPAAHDVVAISFPDSADWPAVMDAWCVAVSEEYRRMLDVIPGDELCIQIDYCTELLDIGGAWDELINWGPRLSKADRFAAHTSDSYVAAHLQGLPDEVVVGFHVCCGILPSYPVQPLVTIGLPVDLANAVQAASGGRVDYFHLPAMPQSRLGYFSPLGRLDVGKARIYLGLECNDGLDGMTARMKAARRFLADFGVAHYCGYLWSEKSLPELLKTLADGADHQDRVRSGRRPHQTAGSGERLIE